MFLHDPADVLDYEFAVEMMAGESISTASVTASTGLTVASYTVGAGVVTAWISTDGTTGPRLLTCQVTTNQGRTYNREAQINVTNR